MILSTARWTSSLKKRNPRDSLGTRLYAKGRVFFGDAAQGQHWDGRGGCGFG